MPLDRRAVVFDLDDTLYPYRRFVRSGFAAVAGYLWRTRRVNPREAFRAMVRASRGSSRGTELQACLADLGLSLAILPSLIEVLTHHQPRLVLPRPVSDVLVALRASGWRIGILTNGVRVIQARKIAALGVARYVDTIVFATEHGSGLGKPEPEPFAEVLHRLRVTPRSAVFVGDDEACDVRGAAAVGLPTIRCTTWRQGRLPSAADVVADRWQHLPFLLTSLVKEARNDHAA